MKHRKEEALAVPMSSMIDVVFLLLIYFIITSKDEISEAHLAINLPAPGSSKASETKPQLLEIEVYENQYSLRGVALSLANLELALGRFSDPELTVIVKVSVQARAKDLVAVLDLCQGQGLSKLNVVTLR
ncbi:MAG: biopolymer transporter ExbD [Lentisphaeria bacterium]|jgi:biopolymer transport protein ExbD|nr:biopolymer transporter ExbD [Lentisphaeria bacterium]NLZ60366.1 biopolymer transporter ExbD [Lentisphaerota bacterium]